MQVYIRCNLEKGDRKFNFVCQQIFKKHQEHSQHQNPWPKTPQSLQQCPEGNHLCPLPSICIRISLFGSARSAKYCRYYDFGELDNSSQAYVSLVLP